MEKVKIAMIGAGNIANTHLASYAKLPNVEIYAACDINESRLMRPVTSLASSAAIPIWTRCSLNCLNWMQPTCASGTAAMLPAPSKLWMQACTFCAKSPWHILPRKLRK